MATQRPTVRSLDHRMTGVEQGIGGVVAGLERVNESLALLREDSEARSERMWDAITSLGGLDGIGQGLAEIAEVLAPVRQFTPVTTAEPLEPGVAESLGAIRDALGGEGLELNFTRVPTRWDKGTRFIGEAVPQTDGGPR